MKKILNIIFYVLKFLLLLVAFAGTLYVMLQMNHRLQKSFMSTIDVFIPFIILLILLIVNIIFNQKTVTGDLFYNVTSNLVFTTITVIAFRAVFDRSMIISNLTDYKIDFNFFANCLPFIKIMLYGLCIADILLMFHIKDDKEKNVRKAKH